MIILESLLLWVIAGVAAMLILQYFGKAPYKPGRRLKSGLQAKHSGSAHSRVLEAVKLANSSAAITVLDPERSGVVSRSMRQSSFVDRH